MNGYKTLQEQVIEEFGKKNLRELELPRHITCNLSKELREYQAEALRLYLANSATLKARHLMFNMATGSGKTLIMAALILDCYRRGYRDFIFFVNSTSVLEKTRANFSDSRSSKYLFAESIVIDSRRVRINIIENLDESSDGAINIYFSTIQGLYSLFRNERENSITLSDLQGRRLVFLADEAHHLNSETKKERLNSAEKESRESWEGIIAKAFASCAGNLMFEFTATIPKEQSVLEKYRDKIIYEYDLKHFCQEGYSKRIFLIKYESASVERKFLGAVLLSLYRECVARRNGIFLKPVVLFKSEGIAESMKNQKAFESLVAELEGEAIEEFYRSIDSGKDEEGGGALFGQSLSLFKEEFGASFAANVAALAKSAFAKSHLLNANDTANVERQQLLLNSLEDADNEVRAIFAVDKLNEGWDVLNLFDIVRLGSGKSKKTTTKEVQLIGRGARLFPFAAKEMDPAMQFRRKFDSDLGNELSALERLSYHTVNEVAFIAELEKQMKESGLLQEDPKRKVTLKINEKAKEIVSNNELYTLKNERKRGDEIPDLFNREKFDNIIEEIAALKVPLFSNAIEEQDVYRAEEAGSQGEGGSVAKRLDGAIGRQVFYKAMNALDFSFDREAKPFGFKGRAAFFESFGGMELRLDRRQDLKSRDCQLDIAKFVLGRFKERVGEAMAGYFATDFEARKIALGDTKEIFSAKEFKPSRYEWLYYDKCGTDSKAEEEFLAFIDERKEQISQSFSEWLVVRNDGFGEFKIYDNRKVVGPSPQLSFGFGGDVDAKSDEEPRAKACEDCVKTKNPSYGRGFEPDFIFFGKSKEEGQLLSVECFMEVKGKHLLNDDNNWKEEFLGCIQGAYAAGNGAGGTLRVPFLPFFVASGEAGAKNAAGKGFRERFEELLKAKFSR